MRFLMNGFTLRGAGPMRRLACTLMLGMLLVILPILTAFFGIIVTFE